MADERFHEFNLEGKQLAFLFMAATAVVVVSFLVGVMVGRGVQSIGAEEPDAAVAGLIEAEDVAPELIEAGESAESVPPSQGDYTYYERLNRPTPQPERLRVAEPVREPEPVATAVRPAVAAVPPPAAAAVETRAAAVQPASTPAPPVPSVRQSAGTPVSTASRRDASLPDVAAEPGGTGFFVQVLSLTSRERADTEAQRLTSKGYRAYVQPTGDGQYRVRVGKYQDHDEAVSIARRLETVEKFNKPWVAR